MHDFSCQVKLVFSGIRIRSERQRFSHLAVTSCFHFWLPGLIHHFPLVCVRIGDDVSIKPQDCNLTIRKVPHSGAGILDFVDVIFQPADRQLEFYELDVCSHCLPDGFPACFPADTAHCPYGDQHNYNQNDQKDRNNLSENGTVTAHPITL